MVMDSITKKITQKINKMIQEEGLEGKADVLLHNLKSVDVPDDAFLTNVYLKKAEYEAQDDEENYRCFICGRKYDSEEDIINCLQGHIEDFLAGIPIKRTDEQLDRIVSQLPPAFREKQKEELKKYGL